MGLFKLLNLRVLLSGAYHFKLLMFELLPFSFHEFLVAKDERLARIYDEKHELIDNFLRGESIEFKEDIFIEELQPLLHEYLTYGGYPAVIKAEDPETKRMILKNIYDTYVSKDVIEFLKFTDSFKYRATVRALAASVGGLINYRELGSTVQSYYKELKRMISILEETYVITLVTPFFKNPRTELKKTPKLYFHDLGLRNHILNNYNPIDKRPDAGHMIENFALLNLMQAFPENQVNFWRTIAKAEVDFVLGLGEELVPIEVKYQRFNQPKISRSTRSFINTYKPDRALIATRDFWTKEKINGTKVLFTPICYL